MFQDDVYSEIIWESKYILLGHGKAGGDMYKLKTFKNTSFDDGVDEIFQNEPAKHGQHVQKMHFFCNR